MGCHVGTRTSEDTQGPWGLGPGSWGQGSWETHGNLGDRIPVGHVGLQGWGRAHGEPWGQGLWGGTEVSGAVGCVLLPTSPHGQGELDALDIHFPRGSCCPSCARTHEGTGWAGARAGDQDSDSDSQGSCLTSSRENLSAWVRRSCLNLGEEGAAEPGAGSCPHPRGRRIQPGALRVPATPHSLVLVHGTGAGGVEDLEGVEDGLLGVGAWGRGGC